MADFEIKQRAIEPGLKAEPIGRMGDVVGQTFTLQGTDQAGQIVEWVVKPTGPNSFELTVPRAHELGTPDSWESISVMTQKVVTRGTADSCGCDGNQCGCQGQNCGSNCNSNSGRLRLAPGVTIPLGPGVKALPGPVRFEKLTRGQGD